MRLAEQVSLVSRICFGHLAVFVQPDKRGSADKPDNGFLGLANYTSALLAADKEKVAWSNSQA